ncbi:MAG: hypothetical protein HY650_15490 [Acidobacteria bacterium]|nr:hypothetical protein [Acidobacteriota bacterium]
MTPSSQNYVSPSGLGAESLELLRVWMNGLRHFGVILGRLRQHNLPPPLPMGNVEPGFSQIEILSTMFRVIFFCRRSQRDYLPIGVAVMRLEALRQLSFLQRS